MGRMRVCAHTLFRCVFLTVAWMGPFPCLISTALVVTPMFARPLSVGQEQVSLGDLARERRNKQAKDAKKPSRVITNDDLPAHTRDTPPTATGAVASAAKTEKAAGQAGPVLPDSGTAPQDEKYFRSRMKELRKKLEDDKAFLARIQRELTEQNSVLPDDMPPGAAGSANDGGYSPRWWTNPFGPWQAWNSEHQWLRGAIKRWEEKTLADQKAISDLVEECRRRNCRPDWVR